jgi:hypothetical protein
MTRRLMAVTVGVAILASLLVLPLATAGGAARTIARIDVSGAPSGGNPDGGSGRFALTAGRARDAGRSSYSVTFGGSGTSASGQPSGHVKATVTLMGKDGQLRIVAKGLTVGASGDGAISGRDVWAGTWTVLGGDGSYAGTHGSGAFVGIAGPSARVVMRLYGHLG